MEAPNNLENDIIKTANRLIFQNKGDVECLFKGVFHDNTPNVQLIFSKQEEGNILATYDCYGKQYLINFNQSQLV